MKYALIPTQHKLEFWRCVDIRKPNDCWNYKGRNGTAKPGVAHIHSVRGVYYAAHKMALGFDGVESFDSDYGCHKCNNPSCCNPRHIYIGTPTTNREDMRRYTGPGTLAFNNGLPQKKYKRNKKQCLPGYTLKDSKHIDV